MTNHGYWWVELGGDDTRVIEDCENIRNELHKWVLGCNGNKDILTPNVENGI